MNVLAENAILEFRLCLILDLFNIIFLDIVM